MSAPDAGKEREARRWLAIARDDLAFAEAGNRDPDAPLRPVCYLAQQAAEKALKAGLCFLGIEVPRSHNLNLLRNLLPEGFTVKEKYPRLGFLTKWAIQARYPGDWPDATRDDAAKALEMARGVLEAVMQDLASLGCGGEEPGED